MDFAYGPGVLVVVRDGRDIDELLGIMQDVSGFRYAQALQRIKAFDGNINATVNDTVLLSEVIRSRRMDLLRALAARGDVNPNACGPLDVPTFGPLGASPVPVAELIRGLQYRFLTAQARGELCTFIDDVLDLFPTMDLNVEITGRTSPFVKLAPPAAPKKASSKAWWDAPPPELPARDVTQRQSVLCWLAEHQAWGLVSRFCARGANMHVMCSVAPHHTARALGRAIPGGSDVFRDPDYTSSRGVFLKAAGLISLPPHAGVKCVETANGVLVEIGDLSPAAELLPGEEEADVLMRVKPSPLRTKVYRAVKDLVTRSTPVRVEELNEEDKARWTAWTTSQACRELNSRMGLDNDVPIRMRKVPMTDAKRARNCLKVMLADLAARQHSRHVECVQKYASMMNGPTRRRQKVRNERKARAYATFAAEFGELVKTGDMDAAEALRAAHVDELAAIDTEVDACAANADTSTPLLGEPLEFWGLICGFLDGGCS